MNEEHGPDSSNDLRRMEQQSERLLTGDPAQPEYDDSDPATIWGKRLGRGLSVVLAAYLLWHLYSTYAGG
ncbi:hypothetical protein FHS85_002338 [Rhodoligotrophos appendicifer]|uniref:hypothetical protein n=1 Tax=Rhodoligotrophos appendicifer TaxID=987056 RepID=UPI0011859834|nr:hypothetical protein [Rhodoligotrophos appendicifer]